MTTTPLGSVTKGTVPPYDLVVSWPTHITRWGQNRGLSRSLIVIPPKIAGVLGRHTLYQVTFSPIGTIMTNEGR